MSSGVNILTFGPNPSLTTTQTPLNKTVYTTTVTMGSKQLDNNDVITNATITGNTAMVEQLVEYYINGVIAIVVIFLGLIGNFLTVVVLTRRTMHSSTNFFLAALAGWDMMVLVCTLLLITLNNLSDDYKGTVFAYVVVYIYPFALVAQTSTVWITVSFTVERYIAVCHPLKAASMCTIPRARGVIIGVSICSIIFNVTRWFEYEIADKLIKKGNDTIILTGISETEFLRNSIYKNVYYFYMYPLVMFIIPLSSLAVLNLCLILAVKRSQKQQKNMNVRQSRENNVTIMLVSVVIVFMLCQVPAMVYNVAYAIDSKSIQNGLGWKVLSSVRNFLVTLNSAVNFILYCALGQKFRRIFIRTFCRCMLSEDDFNSITFHGSVGHIIKVDKNDKSYKSLLLKQAKKGGNHIEMSSNVTQHTLISKYSPCVSRSPTPSPNLQVQNGRSNDELKDTMCKARLLGNSRTPSPV